MTDRLSTIKARRAGAAKGLWRISPSQSSQNAFCIHVLERKETLSGLESSDTIEFIAAAPADIDWLIAEVERLRSEMATATARAEKAEAERDALVEHLSETACDYCGLGPFHSGFCNGVTGLCKDNIRAWAAQEAAKRGEK